MAESSPPTTRLKDMLAEQAVLCGILHAPHEMFRQLSKIGLTADHFGHRREMAAFEILKEMWVLGRTIELDVVWRWFRHKLPVEDQGDSAIWLCDLWVVDFWDERMRFFWIDSPLDNLPTGYASRGLAAAAKVKWLSARRNAIYRANQVIRDAMDGVADADTFEEYE